MMKTGRGKALSLGRSGVAAVILLVVALYFHTVLLHPGLVIWSPRSDYTGFLLPRVAFVWGHLLRGEGLPLWRPAELCGIPTLGNPQIGVFYPPNMLVLLLGPLGSLGVRFILSVLLAGAFTYLYCREIGLGRFASLFSCIAFMLSGLIATAVYAGHIQHLSAIAWFPLGLYFTERIVRRRSGMDSLGLGVCLAYQFLAGHPQYFVYSLLVTAAYFLCIWFPRRRISTLALFAAGPALFLAIAAIQLLPTWEFSSEMTRGGEGYRFYTGMSLPPVMLLTFLQPDLLGSLARGAYWGPGFYWEFCGYVGLTTLALAAAGALSPEARRTRLLLLMAIFALLFSLGRFTPIYYALCRLLPPLTRFRVPSRMLFAYCFAVAVLAGMGLESLARRRRPRTFGPVAVAISCLMAAAIFTFHFFPRPFISAGRALVRAKFNLDPDGSHTMSLAGWLDQVPGYYERLKEGTAVWPPVACLGLLGLLAMWHRPRRNQEAVACTAMIVLMCVELLSFDVPFISMRDPALLHPETPVIRAIERDRGLHRFMDLSSTLTQADVEPFGVQTALNSESGFIRRYIDFLTLVRFRIGSLRPGGKDLERLNTDFSPAVARLTSKDTPLELIGRTTRFAVTDFDRRQNGLNLMNVKYITLNNRIAHPAFDLVLSHDGVYLYRNRAALPRAFLVPAVRPVPDKMEAFSLLARIDPRESAIIPGGRGRFRGAGAFRPVEIVRYGTDLVRCRAETASPAFLVLSGLYYPGWEAFDNGRKTEIFPAYYTFRGVALSPGGHIVEFRYNPRPYRVGRIVSLAALLAALCYAVVKSLKRGRHVR